MASLNVIGNGFDLYHGLPTSYYFFACYLLANYEEIYDQLASMYGISKGLYSCISEELTRGIDDKKFWSEFEESLGTIDSSWVENSLLDNLDLEVPDPAVTLEINQPNIVEDIKDILFKWIRDTVDKDEIYEIVKKHLNSIYIQFDDADDFISFNYTHTLENVYGIDEVYHVHGECCNDNEELIIGHGNDKEILRLQNEISALDSDAQFYQAANNRTQEYRFEKDILESLRKPVHECKKFLLRYLEYCREPDLISVYGCSLGEVDLPYLRLIHEKWPDVKWRFSYYSDDDIKRINATINQLGLKTEAPPIFKLKNPISSDIERSIIVKERIITYPTIDELLNMK